MEYIGFLSKIFCLKVPKKFSVGESFSVSLVFGIEKVNNKEGEGVSRLSVENFLSHSAKNFRRGESFIVSLFSGISKKLGFGGLCHDFRFAVDNFLSHKAEMFRRSTPLCSLSEIFR